MSDAPVPQAPASSFRQTHPLLAAIYGFIAYSLLAGYGIPLPRLAPPAPPIQVQPVVPPGWGPVNPPVTPPAIPPAAPSAPVAPPAPAPAPIAPPRANTLQAIGRIQFGSAGCSATIIAPRRPDGRWDVLTASHCIEAVGQKGRMTLRDKRTFGVRVVAFDQRSDCCWLVTDDSVADLPFAELAERTPSAGARIWHAGFGVDVPGNREDGTVTSGPNSDGQIEMRISVSSGDSGGGLALDDSGRIISCVCCTTARGAVSRVWGASPESINRLRPSTASADDWSPIAIPEYLPSS